MFTDQNVQLYQLEQRANSGARWFFWIAALSLITSITGLSGSNWRFFISLGITQVVNEIANAVAAEVGNASRVVAFVFDLLATAMFAGIGMLALKKHLWA